MSDVSSFIGSSMVSAESTAPVFVVIVNAASASTGVVNVDEIDVAATAAVGGEATHLFHCASV